KPVLIRTLVGVSWSANSLYFDGQHLPYVAYDHVRVLSTTGGPHGPWLALPRPVANAQVTDAGKTLIAASGHQLYVLDAGTLQARMPPVELPANPMRIAIGDGIAVMAFGTNTPTGFQERLIGYSLETGAEIARAQVQGPLHQFEFSADGARLLTVGSASGATEVFDAATLERIGIYRHDEARPVTSAAFVARSDLLWLVARDAQEDTATDADLFAWNARSGAVVERRHLPGLFPVGVT